MTSNHSILPGSLRRPPVRLYFHSTCFSLLIFLVSCKKFVQVDLPKNTLVSAAVFSDSTNATSAVLGIYISELNALTVSGPLNGRITISNALSADELTPGQLSSSAEDTRFYQNALISSDDLMWSNLYKIVYQINACIEGLSASSNLSQRLKEQLTGECLFLRAWSNFHIKNLFGSAPLIKNTNYQVNSRLARTAIEDIEKSIVEDLKNSITLLKDEYPTSGRVRPNKYTAMALLSKVYLEQDKWSEADQVATDIITAGKYNLESDLNNVFVSTSKEAIWQLLPVRSGFETPEGNTFNPPNATSVPRYYISQRLLQSFESNDQRREKWIGKNTVTINGNTVQYYYPYKYKLSKSSGNTKENYMVFRLADIFLVRAESRAQMNNVAGASDDINIVRRRAGLTDTLETDKDKLLGLIIHERRIELFVEWGNRWWDLKRTDSIDNVMNIETPLKGGNWKPTSKVFPIPAAQIRANPFLTQNPGYQ